MGGSSSEKDGGTPAPVTVQRYNVSTLSAIIESITIIDTALYRVVVRTVSTSSEGEESIAPGQAIELSPNYVMDNHSRIDWSIAINQKLRSIRDAHPGSPLRGSVMLNEHQRWLLLGVE